jgi:hypothetical protein
MAVMKWHLTIPGCPEYQSSATPDFTDGLLDPAEHHKQSESHFCPFSHSAGAERLMGEGFKDLDTPEYLISVGKVIELANFVE